MRWLDGLAIIGDEHAAGAFQPFGNRVSSTGSESSAPANRLEGKSRFMEGPA